MEDPNLSWEYKEQLVQAWAACRGEDEARWRPYLDEYALGERGRNPFREEQYRALLSEGNEAQNAALDRRELGERLPTDVVNVPDEMLDLGVGGLRFFEMFLPAARKLGYEDRQLTEYYSNFDAERGMDLSALGRDIEILARCLDTAHAELEEHEKSVAAVRGGWSGPIARAALDAVVQQNVAATAMVDQLASLTEVLTEMRLNLSVAVTSKAYRVACLHQLTIGGYSAAQIEVLADIAVNGRDGGDLRARECVEDASYWFPGLAGDDYRYVNEIFRDRVALTEADSGEVVRTAARIARDWFDANFGAVYAQKRQEFSIACAECAQAVDSAYDAAIAEARMVQLQADFRSRHTAEWAPEPRSPGVPQYAGTSAQLAAPDCPVQTAPASPFLPEWRTLAAGLGEMGELLRPLLDMAASASTSVDSANCEVEEYEAEDHTAEDHIVEGHHSGTDGAGEQDTGPGVRPPEGENRELTLGGQTWELEVDHEGEEIHLEISNGSGETARVGIDFGGNGPPRIVVDDDSASRTDSEVVSGDMASTPDGGQEQVPPIFDSVVGEEDSPVLEIEGQQWTAELPTREPVNDVPGEVDTGEVDTGEVENGEVESGAELAEAGPL